MIQEVIIVEGKHDIQAVQRAVDAECIATAGYGLSPRCLEQITQAYAKRGLIILTDPDSAGERIRKYLCERFPQAKHAFVPREAARANNDIGIEQASPEAIRSALDKVRYREYRPETVFVQQDMMAAKLSGEPEASHRRAIIGAALGIGYANAKQFLYRLNHYGVTREEFMLAVAAADAAAGNGRE